MTTLTTLDLLAGSGDGVAVEPGPVPAELGPISPELVLVDPELARLVRARDRMDVNGFRSLEGDPKARSLLELDINRDVVVAHVPEAHDERWGDDLRLFLAPGARDDALARSNDDAFRGRAFSDRDTPAKGPDSPVPAPRRSRTRIARAGGIAVAAIALAALGVLLGGFGSPSSPEAASRAAAGFGFGSARGSQSVSTPSSAPNPNSTTPTEATPEPDGAPRIMAWAPAAGAAAYEVALYDGARRIFLERTKHTRLAIPVEWRYGGSRHRLEPGVYRWYVWPVPAGASRPSAAAVVQASLTIPSD